MSTRDPFRAITAKAVRDSFDRMNQSMLTPWAFFNAGHKVEITNCRGRTVSYEGVKFEGSPQDVFWGGFFTPCIEDEVAERFLATLKLCREARWYDPGPLESTSELLKSSISKFYGRMADIDRRLKGQGRPQELPLRNTDEDIAKVNGLVDTYLDGMKRILAHEKPSWLRRNLSWVGPLIAAIVASIPGVVALLV